MLEKAVRICDASFGNIYRWEDGALHLVGERLKVPPWRAVGTLADYQWKTAGQPDEVLASGHS